jgi:hypothetical protein
MPARIPDSVREGVIQSWLDGLSFDSISIRHAISEGSVCNIVAEKKHQYGSDELDFYRDLGIAMNRSGLTVQQCADGHRISMMMRRLGIDEVAFERFIEKLSKHYLDAGLGPENLAKQIDELFYFLEQNHSLSGTASIPQICDKISRKQAEEKRLQNKITDLESEKCNLERELNVIRSRTLSAESDLGLTTELKEKLKVNRLESNDLPYCIDLAAVVKTSGYSLQEMAARFSTMAELENLVVNLRVKMTDEGKMHDQLTQENTVLKETNFKHSQKLREIALLDEMGFGLSEFKQLHGLLNEIAEAHGLATEQKAAMRLYFENFQRNYYDYLDLGKSVRERRSELANLKEQRDLQLLALKLTPDVKKVMDSLISIGIKKDDFNEILKFIEDYFSNSRKDRSSLMPRIIRDTREDQSQKFEEQPNSQEKHSKKNKNESDQFVSLFQQNDSRLGHRRTSMPPPPPGRARRSTPIPDGDAPIEESNKLLPTMSELLDGAYSTIMRNISEVRAEKPAQSRGVSSGNARETSTPIT